MRLRGRQGRFIALVVTGWIGARTWLLWPARPGAPTMAALIAAPAAAQPPSAPPPALHDAGVPPNLSGPAAGARLRASSPPPGERRKVGRGPTISTLVEAALPPPAARDGSDPVHAARAADPPALPLAFAHPPAGRAIEASAYLFVRPGSGRATLAPGGSLGGSQIAARVALPLGRIGPARVAVAGRVYAPLAGKGAEAALGINLHPLRDNPLRFSIERRIGLDAFGRDAWSAYAAGGFYAEPRAKLVIDGYAQAGVVGLRARDPFVDGALRIGRRAGRLTLGAGAWGAAQPGAERIDVGPRAAFALPVASHSLTLAIEGRLRLAGHAAPGSGAALTLATDF